MMVVVAPCLSAVAEKIGAIREATLNHFFGEILPNKTGTERHLRGPPLAPILGRRGSGYIRDRSTEASET